MAGAGIRPGVSAFWRVVGATLVVIIADEWRTARKSHICHLCRRQIEPGERYRHQRNKESGDIWTWRNCAHCDELLNHLLRHGYDDDWGITSDSVSEWEPESIAEMRLKVGWKRKWRHRDGSLYAMEEL